MKKHVLRLTALTLAVVTLFGCDKLDNADDVSFEVETDVEFVINETASHQNFTYQGNAVELNIADDSRIKEYANKIKKITIKKIEYQITDYVAVGAAVTFSDGVVSYANATATSAQAQELAEVENLNLATASGTYELETVPASFEALGTLLKQDLKAKIFTSGTLSSTPVSFKVPVTFTLEITANAL